MLVIVIAIIAGLAGYYAGGGFRGPTTPGPPARLIVGTNTPFPPFEFRNATTDVIEGFDIDLIGEVLDRIGYTSTEWDLFDFRDFGALLAAVGVNSVNIAVSAITMNGGIGASRNGTMDFTSSYYESDQGVLQRTGDATNYCADDANCTAAELDGLNVAVQAGTSSEYWVADNLPTANVQTFPDVTLVLQALQTSAVDIVVIDKPAADGIVAGNPQFSTSGTIQTNELYSFAVANNDPYHLVPLMNNALAQIRSDGTYDTLVAKWF
ncbi:MAG TPA: transporter substrate-binding domain-containing protein [Thermoplasmata archaeon]|nr:transporter substrate-binding domain-containing protein [Thermoplasmata archaeon]